MVHGKTRREVLGMIPAAVVGPGLASVCLLDAPRHHTRANFGALRTAKGKWLGFRGWEQRLIQDDPLILSVDFLATKHQERFRGDGATCLLFGDAAIDWRVWRLDDCSLGIYEFGVSAGPAYYSIITGSRKVLPVRVREMPNDVYEAQCLVYGQAGGPTFG